MKSQEKGLQRKNDLVCGAVVSLLGLFALVSSLSWDFGSMRRIGPGFFPAGVGLILIALGLAIAIFEGRGGPVDPADAPARFNLRGLLLIVAGLVAFAALIRTAGLIPAIWAAVFLSALADPVARFRDSALVATIMSIIAMGLFVYLLGFQARAFGAY